MSKEVVNTLQDLINELEQRRKSLDPGKRSLAEYGQQKYLLDLQIMHLKGAIEIIWMYDDLCD